MPVNEIIKTTSEEVFNAYLSRYQEIEMISLSTTDGFPVFNVAIPTLEFETDKMAAAASTLFSVSNAVSKQILNKSFKVTFIESETGNIAFVSLNISDADYVLTMSANDGMNIGQLRVFIHRACNEIITKINSL